MKQSQRGTTDIQRNKIMKQELNAKFVAKAITWFIATLLGGVWFSTIISGCNI